MRRLNVEDRVLRVACNLVLCSVSNQPLAVCECDVRWGGPVALVICDDFNAIVLPDANAGISRAQIDVYGGLFGHRELVF